MNSKDDDTLPLPGFTQELSVDATVDEDFIPTSQPQSPGSLTTSKNSETSFNKSTEELKCSDSRVDDTLPPEAVMNLSELEKNKSTDFIPDTETKTKICYANAEVSCKKKLPVFGTEDALKPSWESEVSKIPESPALELQNVSILNDTPIINREAVEKCEESITEIIVNDSAETVDLETTPIHVKTSEKAVEKLEISSSSNSSGDKCEETQIFDSSSVLLLDQPGRECSVLEKSEKVAGVASEKLYQQETVIEAETKPEGKVNGFCSVSSPPFAVAAEKRDNVGEIGVQNVLPKQEVEHSSTNMESNSASIVTRKVDFKLTVSCFVTYNTKTNKVLQKIILNVNETPKPKPKPMTLEPMSDNTSEKSKRFSTSSSGSVYSDKMGPFALPKRISAVSDHTDSSEEDFLSLLAKERKALERVPWSNEYLLPLKMDDIMLLSIENQELLNRPNIISPRKVRSKHCNGVNHLKEIPIPSSTSEQTSEYNTGELQSGRTSPPELTICEEAPGNKTPESSEPLATVEEKTAEEEADGSIQNEPSTKSPREGDRQTESEAGNRQQEEQKKEEESDSVSLREGLPVFARWMLDKRYYSGVLRGSLKNERWEVKFDDGTSKNVKEEFVMPTAWLKVGALVFAMTDDKYESGQIVDIKRGEEVEYVVELDSEKKVVSVKVSDLCLTDVMAGIIKEKYKPLVGTPRATADIDFDNVLSGKRFREQRTPLRPPAAPAGSSGPKKKSSSKGRKDESSNLQAVKESSEGKKRGLKSENGHLVEDKVISADSPSGTETGETPLRRSAKDTRKRAKPRSLSYEAEETRSGKKKANSWLAPDGTPIPGPSGVKFKKQNKTKGEASDNETETSKSRNSPRSERSRRKRKLDESVEEKKSGESRAKTRNRRG